MSAARQPPPFHAGEQQIQSRLGVRDRLEAQGRRVIRDHLPEQHRKFYAQLPMLIVGAVDRAGRPWASMLAGRPGFVRSPDRCSLAVRGGAVFGDPFGETRAVGTQVGVLGIELHSRRRNRMTGKIRSIADGETVIAVDQTFGNCPQYIQAREFTLLPAIDSVGEPRAVSRLTTLDARARSIIDRSDGFYIATHYSASLDDSTHGTDVSHRGGKPGFVRIDDGSTLIWPDFIGNFHFNTLGNIALNPVAGLLFVDFDDGSLLYLSGRAEVIWDDAERSGFAGAERLVRFTFEEGRLIEQAIPIRWNFLGYSPALERTGSWQEAARNSAAAVELYRSYRVSRIQAESEIVTSFYLEPDDGGAVPIHRPGQFLPIAVEPPGAAKPERRTYTISSAPNERYLRLSIKCEPPAAPQVSAGRVSNYFHRQIGRGSVIRAMKPRGKFVLDETSARPVVLLSAGIGVTPMISMLERLSATRGGCGSRRRVWFVHCARSGNEHAFHAHVRRLAERWPELRVHVRYSAPAARDVAGRDYDSAGRIDVSLLQQLLPFDDYDFYLCGPSGFIQSLYAGLRALNVTEERIRYEFFGRGMTLGSAKTGATTSAAGRTVTVRFERSGIDAVWDRSKGTLLDLAEQQGVNAVYSCRSGICQTCSTRLIAGAVSYAEPPAEPPEDGTALICCAYPSDSAGGQTSSLVLDL